MEQSFHKPQRWDVPFGANMTAADVARLLALAPFNQMDPARFPASASLHDILLNDSRIRHFAAGDIVVREGDYGSSAFLVLAGSVRAVIDNLPGPLLGRRPPQRESTWRALSRLWRNPRLPEVRRLDPNRRAAVSPQVHLGHRQTDDEQTSIFIQDFPAVLEGRRTRPMTAGTWFGEIAALGRTPRTATVLADEATALLEIRWQGLRDLRARNPHLKAHIDQLYRERSLRAHLEQTPLLRHLAPEALQRLADQARFETHGSFDWHASYKTMSALTPAERLQHEPLIAREGDYPNGLVLIRAGFARLSLHYNHGERTLSYLGCGQSFGLAELCQGWHTGQPVSLRHSLRAVGYVDVLVLPTAAVEELVLPSLDPETLTSLGAGPGPANFSGKLSLAGEDAGAPRSAPSPELIEFLVDNRFFNGTEAMVLDLDRCTRCDDCVRACAAVHDNNPRFVRHGPRHDRFMVANACMHCVDPVCMIGCPTGAIHRNSVGGQVVINDDTCIGCGVCANSCPYSNIQMVEARRPDGTFYLDPETRSPLLKAAKCDLCADLARGPACARACPHQALVRLDLSNLGSLAQWLDH